MFKQRKFVSAFIPVLFFAVVAILLLRSSAMQHSGAAVASSALPVNPIIEENQKPGTEAWKSARFDSYFKELTIAEQLEHAQELGLPTSASDAGGGMMQGAWTNSRDVTGYANKTSVNVGGQIASSPPSIRSMRDHPPHGWYNGNGGTEVVAQQVLPGTNYPVPAPDLVGYGRCQLAPLLLHAQYSQQLTSGFYLVWLCCRTQQHLLATFHSSCVTTASRRISCIWSPPRHGKRTMTGGKSLYEYNSPGGRAKKVSYDRPYNQNDGAGHLQRRLQHGQLAGAEWLTTSPMPPARIYTATRT
ncbi:MAG: hypothetical protein KF726_17555 [Anaerolineae bacterium]|nr:hypothetical protein [Anaerolineae bacterium]